MGLPFFLYELEFFVVVASVVNFDGIYHFVTAYACVPCCVVCGGAGVVGDDFNLVANFQIAGIAVQRFYFCNFFGQTNDCQFGMTYYIAEACDGRVAVSTLIQTHTFCACVEQVEAFMRVGDYCC